MKERAPDHSVATMREHWGDAAPDWVVALAEACDAQNSQSAVAKLIGRSAGAISHILRNSYKADLTKFEEVVRAELMRATVTCPGMGEEIRLAECLAWQRKPFASTNRQRVAMFKACRSGCPNSKLETFNDR